MNGYMRKTGNALSDRRKLVWLMLLPSTLTLLTITMYPFLYNLYMSFSDLYLIYPHMRKFIGFGNYIQAFGSSIFWQAVLATIQFSGMAIIAQTLLGIGVGLLFSRDFPAKTILRTLIILPMVAMPVASAYTWRIMFSPSLGVLNYFLGLLGLPGSEWIAGYATTIPSLVLVDVWQWSPFMILIISSGLMSLPKEPYEAARVDGASGWQCFAHITLPLLKPILSVAFVFRLIDSLRTFDIIYTLTGGGPGHVSETLNVHIYLNAFRNLYIGYSGALNIIFLATIIIMVTLIIRWTGFEEKVLNS